MPIEKKTNSRPASDWLETFSTSSLRPLNIICRHLIRSKISTSPTKFFAGRIGKRKLVASASDGLLNGISRNLIERKNSKCLSIWDCSSTVLVFFYPIWKEDSRLGLWLAETFSLWNLWTEFAETWQAARNLRPLPCLSLSGWSENQRDVLWYGDISLGVHPSDRHSFLHFSPTCFAILSWNFAKFDFVLLFYT